MVRFSDLNNLDSGDFGGAPKLPASGNPTPESRENPFKTDHDSSVKMSSGASDRASLYQEAFDYLSQVFESVREGKDFSLEPGVEIMRRVVSGTSSNDPLFVRAIQDNDPAGFLIFKSINVAIFAVRLAGQLGYGRARLEEIGLAGLLHDVGMCRVPEEILLKKDPLTHAELNTVRKHAESGLNILEKFKKAYPYLAETALQVHERIDGSGYPQGLKKDEIHDYAQIVGLVDVYEALTHSRPQREPFSHFDAIKEIIKTCKARFQKMHLKAMLNGFSIFPLSTHVRLNSNAIGRVIETYPDQPMRPRLQIEYDSQGRKVLTERIVKLPENPLLFIVDSVSPDEMVKIEAGMPSQDRRYEAKGFGHYESEGVRDSKDREDPNSVSAGGDSKSGASGAARPLLALIVLACLIGWIPFWQGRQPVSSTSARDTDPPIHTIPSTPEKTAAASENESAEMDAGHPEKAVQPPVADEVFPTEPQEVADGIAKPPEEIQSRPAEPSSADLAAADPVPMPTPPEVVDTTVPQSRVNNVFPISDVVEQHHFPYSILLSSFRSPGLTRRAMGIYREQGLSPYYVRVDLGEDGVWYRIFCGNYASFKEAGSALEKVAVEGAVIKKTRFANLIDTFISSEESAAEFRNLEKLGFSPYEIQRGAGESDLYVGAFYTEKGARDHYAELLARGVDNQVVER